MLLFPTVIDKIVRNSCFGKNYGQFIFSIMERIGFMGILGFMGTFAQ